MSTQPRSAIQRAFRCSVLTVFIIVWSVPAPLLRGFRDAHGLYSGRIPASSESATTTESDFTVRG